MALQGKAKKRYQELGKAIEETMGEIRDGSTVEKFECMIRRWQEACDDIDQIPEDQAIEFTMSVPDWKLLSKLVSIGHASFLASEMVNTDRYDRREKAPSSSPVWTPPPA